MSSTDGQPPLTRRQVRDLERARQGSGVPSAPQPASAPESAPRPASSAVPASVPVPSSASAPPASVAEPGQLTRRQLRALRDAEASRGPVPLQAPGPEPRRTLSEALDAVDQIVSPIEGGDEGARPTSASSAAAPVDPTTPSAPAASARGPVSSDPSVLPVDDDEAGADEVAPGPRRTGDTGGLARSEAPTGAAAGPAPTSTPTVFPLSLSGERPASASAPVPSAPVSSAPISSAPASSAPSSAVPAGSAAAAPATPQADVAPASVPEPTGFVPPVGHWTTQVDAPDDESAPGRALGTHTGQTNALILTDQQVADVTGALNATGEIIITGSIDLPRSLGATGSQARIDNSEIDRLLEAGDAESADTDAAPVRASRAISTHTSTRSVVLAAAQPKGGRLPLVLGIVGGGVGLGIIGVVIAGFATGILGG